MKEATFHGISCLYNPINEELTGKNWFSNQLVNFLVWFDYSVLQLDALPLWVDVDDIEQY